MDADLERLARASGVSPDQLRVLAQSPLFLALAERQKKGRTHALRAQLETLGPQAVDVYRHAMEDADDWGHRLRAADAVVDRIIPRKTLTETEPVVHIHIDARERQLLEDTAREIGEPIDVIALPSPEKLKTVEEVLAGLPE